MMSAAQANGAYNHQGYNPRRVEDVDVKIRGVPHLKQHEQEFYHLQNYKNKGWSMP